MLEDFLNWLRQNEGATEGFRGPFFPRLPPPVPPMPGPPTMMGLPPAPRSAPVPYMPMREAPTPEDDQSRYGSLNLKPEHIAPFARALMPPIPGIGPMSRNPDQYFAEQPRPPQRQPVPAAGPPQAGPPSPWQHTLPPPQPSATTSAAPPQPAMAPWGQRNSGWLEPLSDALVGMGAGIAQTPAGSSPLTYLSQGSASAAQNIGTADDRRLKRQLLKAEIGEKEAKGDIRKQAAEIARGLPADHPARGFFALGLVEKGLEKLTPDWNQLIVIGPDGKPNLNETLVKAKAYIASAGAMKPQYIIKGYDSGGKAIHGWEYPPGMAAPGTTSAVPSPTAGPPSAAPPPQAVPTQGPPQGAPTQSERPTAPPPGVDPYKWAELRAKKEFEEAYKTKQPKIGEHVASQELDKAINLAGPNLTTTGLIGSGAQYLPASDAYKLRKSIESIKARVGLNELSAMREAAAGGASGLGQVTDREHAILQQVLGPLEVGLGDTLLPNLIRAQRVYRAIIVRGIKPGEEAAIMRGDFDKELGIVNPHSGKEGFDLGGPKKKKSRSGLTYETE